MDAGGSAMHGAIAEESLTCALLIDIYTNNLGLLIYFFFSNPDRII